jgi:murein DD-endopeptidase MepM/ murein hydrolase activator NlpD
MKLEDIISNLSVYPVMGEPFTKDNTFEIKVDDFKTELLHLKDTSKTSLFQMYMDELRKVRKKKFAYGGYLEDRSWYARSPLFGKQRSIHLAVDIWAEEDTAIYAPIDGKIHSFADNAGFGNYGPTLILEHDIEGQIFYTLYGHFLEKIYLIG